MFLTPYAKEFSAGAASRTGEWVLSGPPRAVSATLTITLRWPVRAAFGNCRVAIRAAPHDAMRDPVHCTRRAASTNEYSSHINSREPLAPSPPAPETTLLCGSSEQALHHRVFEPSWIGAYEVVGGFTCVSPLPCAPGTAPICPRPPCTCRGRTTRPGRWQAGTPASARPSASPWRRPR